MHKGSTWSYYIFAVLAWGFAGCVALQTLLAGMAVFTDPSRWRAHVMFVHIFEYLPLLMLIFAFAAKLPNAVKWQCAALFALIFVQYATANAPGAGALHPVIALVIFWLSITAARGTGKKKERDAIPTKQDGRRTMHPILVSLLSLFGGFLAGLLLSQIVGVLGYYVFGFPSWVQYVKFLPLVTGPLCAIAVPVMRHRKK